MHKPPESNPIKLVRRMHKPLEFSVTQIQQDAHLMDQCTLEDLEPQKHLMLCSDRWPTGVKPASGAIDDNVRVDVPRRCTLYSPGVRARYSDGSTAPVVLPPANSQATYSYGGYDRYSRSVPGVASLRWAEREGREALEVDPPAR